mgnify:FL=1
MKKTTSLIILLLFSITVFSQSRTNRQKLTFTNSSEKLTSSTGWCYNSKLGEWISYPKLIECQKDHILSDRWNSYNHQNFMSIQTKTVTYKGNTYYVLIVRKLDGEYEYPSIYEDWYYWKETNGYIFTEDEYNKLNNLDGEVTLETKRHVQSGNYYEKYNETNFLDLIQTNLEKETKEYYTTYTFPVLKTTSDGTEVVRFYVPDDFIISYDFNKEYFEVTPENFKKIIVK